MFIFGDLFDPSPLLAPKKLLSFISFGVYGGAKILARVDEGVFLGNVRVDEGLSLTNARVDEVDEGLSLVNARVDEVNLRASVAPSRSIFLRASVAPSAVCPCRDMQIPQYRLLLAAALNR